jgi:hypothetical protein
VIRLALPFVNKAKVEEKKEQKGMDNAARAPLLVGVSVIPALKRGTETQ